MSPPPSNRTLTYLQQSQQLYTHQPCHWKNRIYEDASLGTPQPIFRDLLWTPQRLHEKCTQHPSLLWNFLPSTPPHDTVKWTSLSKFIIQAMFWRAKKCAQRMGNLTAALFLIHSCSATFWSCCIPWYIDILIPKLLDLLCNFLSARSDTILFWVEPISKVFWTLLPLELVQV